MPDEVFLSHSSEDDEFAAHLAHVLRQHGVPTWHSRRNIVGAQQWHDEIGDALRRCDWFCVVLSPSSVESMWVKRETLYALEQERYQNRIVPILLGDCDYEKLSWVLSSLQMVDFRHDFRDGCRELFRVWDKVFEGQNGG